MRRRGRDSEPGATRFSDDRANAGAKRLIDPITGSPIWPALRDATTVPHTWGRRREPGQLALIYLTFVVSGHVDVEWWWAATDDGLWRRAGFADRPSYTTAYERFRELETFQRRGRRGRRRLIALARARAPRIGSHMHVDSTEAETHADLLYDCRPGDDCPNETGSGHKAPKRPERAPTDDHRKVRHDEDEADEDAPRRGDGISRREEWLDDRGRRYVRLRIGEHWYRTLDLTAGSRAYTGPGGAYRFWHGYYNQKAVDHFTGAPLAVVVDSASRQEHDIYPDLYAKLEAHLGAAPQSVITDMGFAVRKVIEQSRAQALYGPTGLRLSPTVSQTPACAQPRRFATAASACPNNRRTTPDVATRPRIARVAAPAALQRPNGPETNSGAPDRGAGKAGERPPTRHFSLDSK